MAALPTTSAPSTSTPHRPPSTSLRTLHAHLATSPRILALLGAGLSAPSGLPTFRGPGGLWQNHDATALATPQAFAHNPGLVWQFYAHRRAAALAAEPNAAHYALAELARRKPGFLALSQNVDGLSARASHPPSQILHLHGSLLGQHCTSPTCAFTDPHNTSPLPPALSSPPPFPVPKTSIIPPTLLPPTIPTSALPTCPLCAALLRPSVVWFGENLPDAALDAADAWLAAGPVDLVLVVGTSAGVMPAAGYIAQAHAQGARVAVVNVAGAERGVMARLRRRDWLFEGDAAVLLPAMVGGGIPGVGGEAGGEADVEGDVEAEGGGEEGGA